MEKWLLINEIHNVLESKPLISITHIHSHLLDKKNNKLKILEKHLESKFGSQVNEVLKGNQLADNLCSRPNTNLKIDLTNIKFPTIIANKNLFPHCSRNELYKIFKPILKRNTTYCDVHRLDPSLSKSTFKKAFNIAKENKADIFIFKLINCKLFDKNEKSKENSYIEYIKSLEIPKERMKKKLNPKCEACNQQCDRFHFLECTKNKTLAKRSYLKIRNLMNKHKIKGDIKIWQRSLYEEKKINLQILIPSAAGTLPKELIKAIKKNVIETEAIQLIKKIQKESIRVAQKMYLKTLRLNN